MQCSEVQQILDDYLDGDIPTGKSWDIKRHVADCTACRTDLEQRRAIRRGLSELPVPEPSAGFFDRAFEALDQRTSGRRRGDQGPGWPQGRRMAIAAAIAVVCGLVFVMQQPFSSTASAGIPEVTIAMHEVTPVRLVFAADDAVRGARLSLQLPAGIELAGYNGRSELSWTTNLEPGKNELRLPLVGHVATADDVIATLEHTRGKKTFRLKVKVI